MPGATLQFGEFELNCGRFQLLRKGCPLRIERKPLELLILLASREGELVTRAEIADQLWSSEVFVDTEHGINTAVRKLRHVMRDDAAEPQYIETVTGLGYRFIAPVEHLNGTRAEPVAELVSAPGLRPATLAAIGGEKAESAFAQSTQERGSAGMQTRPHRRSIWIAACSMAVLLVVAALGVGREPIATRLLHRNSPSAVTSIAVLPLNNLSGDPNQQYFVDGMTDELITMLARESNLRVVSRTSVMQYRGASRPLPEIARSLNVSGIVEGSVTRGGDHVHLTLQLIQAETDAHIWANSYDRAADDTVTLPGDAAREIARRLNSSVSASPARRYVDPAAHDAYLHGMYLWYSGSNEKAGEYFRKAVEIQPDYALGLSGLAAYYSGGTFEGELDPRDALPKAETAAAKAIALDDSLPIAHSTMAATVYAGRWDWQWSEREIRRALELNPNFAEGWHLYAKMLGPLNRNEEAISAQKRATELDPFARPGAMARILLVARQWDACISETNLRSELYPHNANLRWIRMNCYRGKGENQKSVEEWIEIFKEVGNRESAAAVESALKRGGYKAVLRWQIAEGERIAKKQYVSPVNLAQLHALLGEREKTLALLEEGFRQHSPLILWIQCDPAYDFLHSDPRFRSIVQRTGLPPAF